MRKKFKLPLVVAVTGGIGTGQTAVCRFFEEWNCKVINADLKARQLINKSRGIQKELQNEFGKHIFVNRRLDRKRLAEIAFKDEMHTGKLNRIVHPRMVESIVEEMERARFSQKFPIILVDAALIYEISIERNFDTVIVITAPMEERWKRVKERDGMTRQQFKDRVEKQIPVEEKARWADIVINNNGSMDDLKIKTRRVYNKLMDMQRLKEKEKKVKG